MLLLNLAKRIFSPEYLVKGKWLGDPYSGREVYTTFARIACPAVFETVLIGLMNFVDKIMVSSCGTASIAAVGLTDQPRLVFYAIFFALNVGVTAIVSRRKGEENREGANRTLSQAMLVCLVLAVLLFTVSFVFCRPLLRLAGANTDTLELSSNYFKITMVGMLFTSFGMAINAAHRGCGNTKISMYTNISANIVNVIFNYLLINGIGPFPELGVTGAAIATLMGNVVSCLISLKTVLYKPVYLRISLKDMFSRDFTNLKALLKVSTGASVEQLFVRIGFFAYVMLVARFGTTDFATHNICMSIINLSFTVGDGLSISVSSLVGQNLGRNRSDMASVYGKATQRVGLIIAAGLFCLFMFGGNMLMSMFTKDPAIIAMGIRILRLVAIASPAQIVQLIYTGCLRGSGDTKYVAFASLISIMIIRPVSTYILCYPLGLGLIGAWYSLVIDMYIRLLFAGTRFYKGKWKQIKL